MLHKKGFIFTMDVLLGVMMAFLVVGAGIYFTTRGSEPALPKYQMFATGSDIVSVLDEMNVFDSLNPSVIEVEMEKLLPAQYEMLIRLEDNVTLGNEILEAGNEVPFGVSILSGQRVVWTIRSRYVKLTYFIWVKQQE